MVGVVAVLVERLLKVPMNVLGPGWAFGQLPVQLQPQVLVLNHQLLWHATEQDLIDEVTAACPGPLIYGRDLTVI